MSPGCERNAGAETGILTQRTVVPVGKRGCPIGHEDRERLVGHKRRKGYLCRLAPHVVIVANLPERRVES